MSLPISVMTGDRYRCESEQPTMILKLRVFKPGPSVGSSRLYLRRMTMIAYRNVRQLTTLLLLLGVTPIVESQESLLVFYRDTNGHVTEQSRVNARLLMQIAREQGSVTLWLTLDFPYNIYPDQMTAEEIAAQDEEVERRMTAILQPLIRRRQVQYLDLEQVKFGPTYGVSATPSGLVRLLRDDRILQISGAQAVP